VVYGNLAVVGMRFHGVVNFSPSAALFLTILHIPHCTDAEWVWR